jgi:hypothetical protein
MVRPREEEQVALPYSMNEYFAVLLSILYICHSERKIHHKKCFFFEITDVCSAHLYQGKDESQDRCRKRRK